MSKRVYEIVPNFFVQDGGVYDGVRAVLPRFGLLDSATDRWRNTIDRLKRFNDSAEPNVTYKLVIAGRHGQGFHNLAEIKYGTKRWDEYWAKLDGDGDIVWGPDPLLTTLGEDQANDANSMWIAESTAGLPLPDGLYCSPLTRALQTCQLTFAGVLEFSNRRPLILENAREIYGVHSCDQRRSRTYIHTEFPEFDFEEGFSEEDKLFDPKVREEQAHVTERAHRVLDYIFVNDSGLFISITAHNGIINGLIETTKHAPVNLPTGGVLPMVVKCSVVAQ